MLIIFLPELSHTQWLDFIYKGGQSRDTHMVISHDLFTFCARLKVSLTIIIFVLWVSEMTSNAEYSDYEMTLFFLD